MVNVGKKAVTRRTARVRAIVELPPAVLRRFKGRDLQTKKGPVFPTAIVAGILAAKTTSALIPMCHPIPLEDCEVSIEFDAKRRVVIECSVEAHHKTGVEMEALTGAAVAALTVYDMCKAYSQEIVIRDLRLLEKRGGKSDYAASR